MQRSTSAPTDRRSSKDLRQYHQHIINRVLLVNKVNTQPLACNALKD